MSDKHIKTKEETVPKEQFLRLAADFENYKKRMGGVGGALSQAMEIGKGTIVGEILDVLDTLDSAKAQEEWTDGIELSVNKFLYALKKHKVERIETEGKSFDPAFMEAVGTVVGGESGAVQSTQRTGWKMNEKVIRPARVIVYQ